MLGAVNRRIIEDTDATRFVTAFYGVIDPRDGTMVYCNAGHPPPILIRAGETESLLGLARTGIPLGIDADQAWEQGVAQLACGDVVVSHTDGITDAQNADGDFFDQERLDEILRKVQGLSAEEIKELVLDRVAAFKGDADQYDDMALLVVLRCP